MDDPNQQMTEKMFYALSAKYLPILRDKLIEMSQVLEDRLFEMDCEQTQHANKVVHDTLESLKLRK